MNKSGVLLIVHLTVAVILRTTVFAEENWQGNLAHVVQACTFVVCVVDPSNIPYSRGHLVFGQDMMFNQKVRVDRERVKKFRQDLSKAYSQGK